MKKLMTVLALVLVGASASPPGRALAVHAPHSECCYDLNLRCCILYILESASGFDFDGY